MLSENFSLDCRLNIVLYSIFLPTFWEVNNKVVKYVLGGNTYWNTNTY